VAHRGYRFLAPVTHKDLSAETGSEAASRPRAPAASAGPLHELQGTTRERMVRELAEAVETLTAVTPLVVVLEDLHWSDYATGVQMTEAAKHPYSRVMAWWAVGFRALRQGDLPQAIRGLEQARDLVQGADLQLLVPMVAAPKGAAYALAGRTADAVQLLEQAVTQAVARQYLWDQALRVV
jgi:hypothetical protein